MILSRLITNKLILKNLFILNNSINKSISLTSFELTNIIDRKRFDLSSVRCYSQAVEGKDAKANLPEMDKSLAEMDKSLAEMDKSLAELEKNLTDPIAIKQANFKLANLNFLKEAEVEKKPIKQESILDPYVKLMRLNNLAPVQLVYWPAAWAIIGSAAYLHTTPDFYMLGLFAAGALAMRSAGCIVNDIWDRNIDKQVERTRDRPLASGKVGLLSATTLLAANLSVSLAVLLQLNLTTQVLGACALFPVAIYPAAKRFTNWPQAVLGVTYNWGVLLGWSSIVCSSAAIQAQNLSVFLPAAALYVACINWTLFYDTIYAFQDKEYDEKMGLKSTAILFQKNPTRWLFGFSTLCTSNLALFGWLTSQEPIFYITVGAAMLHFIKQMALVDYKSPKSCMTQFKSNSVIGYLIAFGLLASIYIK